MYSRTRTVALFVALAGMAVAVVGCASSGGPSPAALEGAWTLESFGGTTELVPADPKVTTEITFADGEVSGAGGVNSFSGTYETSGDNSLVFGPLAATEMAGPAAAMDQESQFFAALGDTRHFEFNEDKLVLSDLGNNTLAVLIPK